MAINKCLNLNTLLFDLFKTKGSNEMFDKFASDLLHKRTKYQFARHMQGCDIVSEIKLKLRSGEFKWNPEKSTLTDFFYSRIRTEVYNLVKKEINFIPVPLHPSDAVGDDCFENDDENLPVDPSLITGSFDNENVQENINIEDLRDLAPDIFQNSDEEYCVADDLLKGFKNRQIAADLGISSIDVHYIKRRVMRKFKSTNKPSEKLSHNHKPGAATPELKDKGDIL
jgi:hypothetical protein